MSRTRCTSCGAFLLVPLIAYAVADRRPGDEVTSLVVRIKGVQSEGAGNATASEASQQLAKLGPEALMIVLRAMDDADAVAANWLRAAVDTIAERAVLADRSLPTKELEHFVLDRTHAGPVRRLAYEWLTKVDATAPDRLIPGMVDDPSVELRRDAVARAIDQAQQLLDSGDPEPAVGAFQKTLAAARDHDQVELVAKRLQALGQSVDLARHFGFIQRWHLIGPFDNSGKGGFDAVYPPEQRSDPAGEHPGKNSPVRWMTYSTSDTYGLVDLNKVLGKHMGVVAYAMAEIPSPEEQPVHIRAGSNNAVKIWLNGELLYVRDEYHHGMRMDQHLAAGVLRPGRNMILIKVCQNEQTEDWAQSWSFQARVCDLTGGGIVAPSGSEASGGDEPNDK